VVDNSRDTLKAAVVVFGYAITDTILLQNDPTSGLDLPLRISVTEDTNGLVQVATRFAQGFSTFSSQSCDRRQSTLSICRHGLGHEHPGEV
jgi:uncharacterized protein (DUF302 family)